MNQENPWVWRCGERTLPFVPRDESSQPDAERLARVFSDQEPPELRSYLAVLKENAVYHAGSRVPVIGEVRQLESGLWVPASVQLAPAPIDLMKTYITFREVFGQSAESGEIRSMLGRYNRDDVLRTCALLLRVMVDSDTGLDPWHQALLQGLRPEYRERLANLLRDDRPVFSRQSLHVLAKLALVDCGAASDTQALPIDIAIGFFSLLVHGVLGSRNHSFAEESGDARIGGFPPRLSMEIVANQWFNRSMDEANFLALFERRWISGDRASTQAVAGQFKEALGFGINELAAVALALWAGSRGDNRYVIFGLDWIAPLRLPAGRLEAVLALIAIDPALAADKVRAKEIEDGALDWNFDTFERYPLLRLNDHQVLLLDPALLVRRCLGWAPMYDLAAANSGAGRPAEHALADASEAYAFDILHSMYGGGSVQRLYVEDEIKSAYGTNRRNADALIDYGASVLVVEITARRPLRGFLQGGPPELFVEQLDVLLDEADQIASTARAFDGNPERLLKGAQSGVRHRVYPVIVMTEGFPTGPITLPAIRSAITEAGLFADLDAAPIEVVDLVELEMLESLTQAGGPDIPTLLTMQNESNFHADSVRNYLTTRADLDIERGARIDELFSRPFDRIANLLDTPKEELEDPG